MNRVSWFAYRHPFVAAGLGTTAAVGMGLLYGAPVSWAIVVGVVTGVGGLIMWWPSRGVLARDVDDWMSETDPRVRKPDPPGVP